MTSKNKKWALDPTAVRRRASSVPGCIEVVPVDDDDDDDHNETKWNNNSTICCFIVGCNEEEQQQQQPPPETTTTTTSISSVFSSILLSSGGDAKEREEEEEPTPGDDAYSTLLARVTVYCDTGTIATGRILPQVFLEEDEDDDDGSDTDILPPIRHVFRRNVTNLDVVERCLRNPDRPLEIDWNLMGFDDDDDDHDHEEDMDPAATIITSPRKNRELLDLGHAMLRGEHETLISHRQCLDDNYHLFRSSPTQNTGMEFQFNLPATPMKHVDQCLHDIQRMRKVVHHVATNGQSAVFLYGNGGVAYTPNIPRNLYNLLVHLKRDDRQQAAKQSKSKIRKRPKYAALGTRERYYLHFYEGTYSYRGPKQLDAILSDLDEPPRSVSFGSHYDSYFVVFHDGTYAYHRIPEDLETKLIQANHRKKHDQHNHPTPRSSRSSKKKSGSDKENNDSRHQRHHHATRLSCVNLGTNGEWFLKSLDGRVGWSGGGYNSNKSGSNNLEQAVQELLDDGHRIIFMDFGDHGSYFVSYD